MQENEQPAQYHAQGAINMYMLTGHKRWAQTNIFKQKQKSVGTNRLAKYSDGGVTLSRINSTQTKYVCTTGTDRGEHLGAQRATYLAAYSRASTARYYSLYSQWRSAQSHQARRKKSPDSTRYVFFQLKSYFKSRRRSDKDDDKGIIYHLPARASRNSSLDPAPQGPMRLEHLGFRGQTSKASPPLVSWS